MYVIRSVRKTLKGLHEIRFVCISDGVAIWTTDYSICAEYRTKAHAEQAIAGIDFCGVHLGKYRETDYEICRER